jgi:hypothetical protein
MLHPDAPIPAAVMPARRDHGSAGSHDSEWISFAE